MPDEARYPIQMAARRSGLTPHVIRVWERRYGVIKPRRGHAARRLYSDADIERLSCLREATAAGHPISTVAQLDAAELDRLLVKADTAKRAAFSREVDAGTPFRNEALEAVKHLNSTALKDSFQRAVIALGHHGFLQVVVAPLADEIGVHWRNGTITAAHEHFFVAAAKMFLGRATEQFAPEAAAPNLISCTPVGQLHELGAFMVTVAATHLGWRVAYLGASLPAAEIAGAARQNNAAAVALSIIYPDDDPKLPEELLALRRYLPDQTRIIVGGRAAAAYGETLAGIGAIVADTLDDCCQALDGLRREHRR